HQFGHLLHRPLERPTMPSIPNDLRADIHDGRCILFVGAGASLDAQDGNGNKLPHWGMLIAELLDLIQDSADPDPPPVVAEIRQMLNQDDFMALSEWIDFRLGDAKFRSHMIKRLATAKSSPVHQILSSKPFRAVVTTNYDSLIEIHWQQQ